MWTMQRIILANSKCQSLYQFYSSNIRIYSGKQKSQCNSDLVQRNRFGIYQKLGLKFVIFISLISTLQQQQFCDQNIECRVHQGFYHAYLDINQQVIAKVKSYISQFGLTQIILVGHGMGAALATHATAFLIKSGIKVTLLQTYGSPRVGNKQFSAWFQAIFPNTLKPRITHGKDPVAHLPPEAFGYKHIPTQIFYAGSVSQGYKICNDQVKQDPTCSDQYTVDDNYIDHGTYYDIDFNAILLTC